MLEIEKTHPAEFGGVQSYVLLEDEIGHRYCAVKGCGNPGYGQVHIALTDPPEYRVMCRQHFVVRFFMELGLFGDPDYRDEAVRVARGAGVNARQLFNLDRALPAAPEDWTCVRCGGAMQRVQGGWFHGGCG